jgi:hypothetical protein
VHKAILRKLKEEGLRKGRFMMLSQVSNGSFYELARYGEYISCRRGQSTPVKEDNMYLLLRGRLVLIGEEAPLKLVQID